MSGFPSDRHAYQLKCFMHPMRYCFSSSSSSFYKFFNTDPKRIDTKSVIIDFEIFQQMSDPSFIENLKEKTDSFLQQLVEHQNSGRTP